jgi:hypothetical protein
MEVSGWSDYCESKRKAGGSILDTLSDESGEKIDTGPMLQMMNELENKYEQEDEEMMIRLIKIRRSLWT